jgi:lysozyme
MTYDRTALKARLRLEEGEVLHAYQDSLGFWTIGVGHLIDPRKGGGFPLELAAICPIPSPITRAFTITAELEDRLLDFDIDRCERLLDAQLPWWRKLDDVRQQVIVDLTFNMGWAPGVPGGFDDFHNTTAALESARWADAAWGLRNSLWYRQVGSRRADPLCVAVLTGAFFKC